MFKDVNVGIKRLIIVIGGVVFFAFPPIYLDEPFSYWFDMDEDTADFFFNGVSVLVIYTILTFMGLWVYSGFKK